MIRMLNELSPRARALLQGLKHSAAPLSRNDLATKAKLSNKNITPELGATKPDIRNKYEGKGGSQGYTATKDGRSLIGLRLIATEKTNDSGRAIDTFWLTDKGREVADGLAE